MKRYWIYLDWIFAGFAALLGGWLVLEATSIYGAGVSSDSVYYLSTAENFAAGKGFFDLSGSPFVLWPPLYPFILGVFYRLSGITPFVWGRFLNALVMTLLIFSAAILFKRCFPDRRLWFYLGTAATLTFTGFYTLAANIGTDLLFTLLMVWFFLAAQAYLSVILIRQDGTNPDDGTRNAWLWLAILSLISAASAMLRWVGLAMIVTQALIIWIALWKDWKKASLYSLISCGLAALPFVLWVGGRNYLQYGTLFGSQEMKYVSISGNLLYSLQRIAGWFPTFNRAISTIAILLLCAGLVVLFMINRRADWFRWLKRLFTNPILPVILLTVVYFGAMLVTAYTKDHIDPIDDRYQVLLFFALLIVVFTSFEELVFPHLKGRELSYAMAGVTVLFLAWLIYPTQNLVRFVTDSREQGVTAYNMYNTQKIDRSGLTVLLKKNPLRTDLPIYSNEPEEVYFLIRRASKQSPFDPVNYTADIKNLGVYYAGWPPVPEAYLIWFKPNIKSNTYSPDDLEMLVEKEKLFKRYDGELYIIRPLGSDSLVPSPTASATGGTTLN